MMPSWCQQINWGNCGIPWVNCAVLCVKDDWKRQFWGLSYCLSKLRSLLSWFRQVWRHTVKSLSLTCIGLTIASDSRDCLWPLSSWRSCKTVWYLCPTQRQIRYSYKVQIFLRLIKHHAVKFGGVAPHILNFEGRWGWVVSFTRRSMYPRDFPPVPTGPNVIGTRAAVYVVGKETMYWFYWESQPSHPRLTRGQIA